MEYSQEFKIARDIFVQLSRGEQLALLKVGQRIFRETDSDRVPQQMEPKEIAAQCQTCLRDFSYIRTGRGRPRKHCLECRPVAAKEEVS